MRRTAVVPVAIVAFVVLAVPTPAGAYVDRGFDPPDTASGPYSGQYDIRSTLRRVEEGANGRYLDVVVRTYDEGLGPGSWVTIDVRLDSRGDLAADAILHVWIQDMSGGGCELTTRSGHLLRNGELRFPGLEDISGGGDAVGCRVRSHPLHATKPIRWSVTITNANGEPVYDVAPDVGMYG